MCVQNNKWRKCHRRLAVTEHKLVFLFRHLWRRTPANRTNTVWRTLTWQSIDRCWVTSPSRSTNSSLRWQKASYNPWSVSYIGNKTEDFVHLGFWTRTILHKTKIYFDFWVLKLSVNDTADDLYEGTLITVLLFESKDINYLQCPLQPKTGH